MAQPAEARLQTVCLLALTAMGLGATLYWLKPVLIPLGLAVFLYMGLTPIVDHLVLRRRWPRWLATAVSLLPATGALFGVGAVITTSLRRLRANGGRYQDSISALLERAVTELPLLEQVLSERALRERLAALPLTDILVGTTNALFTVVSNLVLVMIFVLFLLVSHIPREEGEAGPLRTLVDRRVRKYLVVKFLTSVFTGTAVGLLLGWLGLDLWMVFGLLAFGFNFIPSVGGIIATLLPLPMVLVSPGLSAGDVLAVIALPGAVQFVVGNVVEPMVLGDSLDLHPVTILAALIFFGSLWGVVGMLMAAPITAILKLALEEYGLTRPFAEMMARAGGSRASKAPPAPEVGVDR